MQDEKFSVAIDALTKVVQVKCSGFWSPEEAKCYLDQIVKTIGAARSRNKNIRVLVNNRDASVQTLAAIDEIGDMISRAYRPEDRLAIVLGSQLLKRQMDRLPAIAITRIFVGVDEANEWLMSDEPA